MSVYLLLGFCMQAGDSAETHGRNPVWHGHHIGVGKETSCVEYWSEIAYFTVWPGQVKEESYRRLPEDSAHLDKNVVIPLCQDKLPRLRIYVRSMLIVCTDMMPTSARKKMMRTARMRLSEWYSAGIRLSNGIEGKGGRNIWIHRKLWETNRSDSENRCMRENRMEDVLTWLLI